MPRDALLLRSTWIAAGLTLLSIWMLDGPVASMMSSLPAEAGRAFSRGVMACEWLFGFRVSPYLYGALLLLAGVIARFVKHRTIAKWLFFIGLAHVTTRFLVGILKTPFSRLRPFEAFTATGWHDIWFAAAGNSFPSGHAAHFWSLFFPLAVLFPRFWAPLAILPVLISLARVVANHHYVSDVVASAAVAAFVTWVYAKVILRDPVSVAGKNGTSAATLSPSSKRL